LFSNPKIQEASGAKDGFYLLTRGAAPQQKRSRVKGVEKKNDAPGTLIVWFAAVARVSSDSRGVEAVAGATNRH
jgi:hypothetical protein